VIALGASFVKGVRRASFRGLLTTCPLGGGANFLVSFSQLLVKSLQASEGLTLSVDLSVVASRISQSIMSGFPGPHGSSFFPSFSTACFVFVPANGLRRPFPISLNGLDYAIPSPHACPFLSSQTIPSSICRTTRSDRGHRPCHLDGIVLRVDRTGGRSSPFLLTF